MKKIFAFLLLLLPLTSIAGEVASYPNATPLGGAERILGSQGGKTVNITPAQLTAYTSTTYAWLSGNAISLSSGVVGTLQAAQFPALTGDVTGNSGSLALTIPSGTITLAKQANLAANSFECNNTGSPARPIACTPTQAKSLLAIANTDISGLGSLATQNGTFSGTSSGTNTGDQTITLTGPVTGSGTGAFATLIGAGPTIGNATSSSNTIDVQGVAGNARGMQMDTGAIKRWNVVTNNVAESGNNTGSQFAINAYSDTGAFSNDIIKATRANGVFGDGSPSITDIAPYTQTNTLMPTPGGVIGTTLSASNTADVMPTYALPSNPITTNSTTAVVVNWPNCCVANGPLSVTKDSWVLILNTGSPAVLNGLNVPTTASYFNGTGSQSGTTLTVAMVNGGSLAVGSVVYGGSGLTGQITAILTGTGGVGTYTLSTTATIGTVNLVSNPWLEVAASDGANNFTVNWPNAANASSTLGGTTLTVQPSVSGILKKTGNTSTSFSNGFPMQEQSLFTANPLSYIPTAALGASIPRYQQFWTVFATPNDKSGLNAWTADYRETDLINRGIDGGYAPNLYTAPNRTVAYWTGPLDAPFSFNAGGGTATNWNTVYTCFGPTDVGVYDCNSVQPNALVGALQDPTGHGGVGYDFFGSYTPLAANPYKTAIGTKTVTITPSSTRDLTGLSAGQAVYIPDTQYSVTGLNGVTFGGASYTINSVGATNFTITGGGVNATGTGAGGNTGLYLYLAQYVPYAPVQFWGEYKHGIVCSNCKFDTDEISLPGFTVGPTGNVTATLTGSTGLPPAGIASSVGPYVLGNVGTGVPGAMTVLPASVLPPFTGDANNSVTPTVLVVTGCSGNCNTVGIQSEGTLNPPTNVFIPPEIDFTAVGTSGVVLVNGVAGSVTTGTYTSVAGTGGTGSGVVATVVAAAGVATSITITTAGTGYSQNDALSFVTGSGTATGNVRTTNNPVSRWNDSGATANYGDWECHSQAAAAPSRSFICGATTDTFANEHQWLNITGTGNNFTTSGILTALNFGNGTDNPTYNFLGTGAVTFGGALNAGPITGTKYVHGDTVLCTYGGPAVPPTGGVVHTGDSVETNLAQCSMAAGAVATTGVLRVTSLWYRSAVTTNIVNYAIRIGAAGATSGGTLLMNSNVSTTSVVSYASFNQIFGNASAVNMIGNSQSQAGGLGTSTSAPASSAANFANALTVNFNCADTTSIADSCGLYAYTVEAINP